MGWEGGWGNSVPMQPPQPIPLAAGAILPQFQSKLSSSSRRSSRAKLSRSCSTVFFFRSPSPTLPLSFPSPRPPMRTTSRQTPHLSPSYSLCRSVTQRRHDSSSSSLRSMFAIPFSSSPFFFFFFFRRRRTFPRLRRAAAPPTHSLSLFLSLPFRVARRLAPAAPRPPRPHLVPTLLSAREAQRRGGPREVRRRRGACAHFPRARAGPRMTTPAEALCNEARSWSCQLVVFVCEQSCETRTHIAFVSRRCDVQSNWQHRNALL